VIRAFVALPLPEEVVARLVAAQAGLPAGRAMEPDTLHLTLAFLGEHPAPAVEDVHYALSAIRSSRFTLRLEGLGMFGEGKPRVVYAGVAPEPALGHLREKVVQAARGAGLELERGRFRPHVTLARLGGKPDPEEFERLRAFVARGAGFRAGPFEAERFELMRSRLGRGGATYEALAAYDLEAPPADRA
jgi:2'-5' RNA ligase